MIALTENLLHKNKLKWVEVGAFLVQKHMLREKLSILQNSRISLIFFILFISGEHF